MNVLNFLNKPHDFYAPAFVIKVEGQDLLKEKVEIFSVMVNRTIDGASDFSFTVNNPMDDKKRDFPYLAKNFFKVNSKVEIFMGYGDRSRLKRVFVGLITALDVSFPSNGVSQLTVKGYDRLHLLMKGTKSDSWGSANSPVKYSEVVRDIASIAEYHLGTSRITDTRERHRQVKQDKQSDYEFIKQKLADEISFEFFVDFDDIVFRSRSNDRKDVAATLKWGANLVSFSPQINTAEQIREVHVRGWDPNNQQAIIGRARSGSEHGRDGGDETGSESVAANNVRQIWRPVSTQREADDIARSILEKTALKFVTGSGESLGLPEIEAGKDVELQGLGSKFSKSYYVEKVTHTINISGYKTTFNVTENSI